MGVHVSAARPDASAGADCYDGQTFGNKCACYVDCCRGQVSGSGGKGRLGGDAEGVKGGQGWWGGSKGPRRSGEGVQRSGVARPGRSVRKWDQERRNEGEVDQGF